MGNSLTLGSSVQVYRAKMDPVCFSQIKHQRADVQLYVYIWTFAVTVVDSRLPTHPLYIIVFFMTVSGKPKKCHLIWRWQCLYAIDLVVNRKWIEVTVNLSSKKILCLKGFFLSQSPMTPSVTYRHTHSTFRGNHCNSNIKASHWHNALFWSR